MKLSEKKQRLQKIPDEKAFRDDLCTLLKKMGYKGVELLHGANEHGKDIVFYATEAIIGERQYIAVVAKIGKLTGGTSKDSGHIVNIANQIKLAMTIPFNNTTTKKEQYINTVWVVTNDTISEPAKKEILNRFGDEKGIYERNVKFYKGDNLIEWLDRSWPEYYISGDPFIIEYCSSLRKRYEKIEELKSLGYSKEAKDLLEIFIEPTLVEEKKGDKKKGNPIDYVEYSTGEILKDDNSYWISGPLGSGKSTVLRKIILKIVQGQEGACAEYSLPITLKFKELISDGTILKLKSKIIEILNEFNKFDFPIDPEAWLEEGKIIIFLDGFDEIFRHELMDLMLKEINEFRKKYPSSKIIATSRDYGLDAIKPQLAKFVKLDLRPLSYKQMIKFISLWFVNKEQEKQDMTEVLKNTVLANKLPKTPMVLTLLAILFDERRIKELPANLTELYSMFTQLYLGRWDIARNVENIFEYSIKESILMHVANWMHVDGRDKVSEDALIFEIDKYAEERRLKLMIPEFDSVKLLDEIIEKSSLLYKDEGGRYAFKHLSFQEYFTSLFWDQKAYSNKDILSYALDRWWEYVIFFYIGKKKDAPELIRSYLELKTENNQEHFHKLLSLGQLLQAAYLTNHSIKVEAIESSIDQYSKLLPAVIEDLKGTKQKLPESFLILLFKLIFSQSYASTTLSDAIQEVFYNNYNSSYSFEKISFLKVYFLAYILALLDIKEPIEDIATNPTAFPPIYSFLINIDLKELNSEYGIEISDEAEKKIKKRIKRNLKFIMQTLDSE